MAGRRFWYRVTTGEEVPVEPSEGLSLPLLDKPRLFGLHEEMLDEARKLGADGSDHKLVSLAVKNGWTMVDAVQHKTFSKVIAPSEAQARIAIRRLQFHVYPKAVRIETLDDRLDYGRKVVEIYGWSIQRFVEGAPLHALRQED